MPASRSAGLDEEPTEVVQDSQPLEGLLEMDTQDTQPGHTQETQDRGALADTEGQSGDESPDEETQMDWLRVNPFEELDGDDGDRAAPSVQGMHPRCHRPS